jgi:hypothetical protein
MSTGTDDRPSILPEHSNQISADENVSLSIDALSDCQLTTFLLDRDCQKGEADPVVA